MKQLVPVWVKDRIKWGIALLPRLAGIRLLTKAQTIDFLAPYKRSQHLENRLLLPEITDAVVPARRLFPSKEAVSLPTYSWLYQPIDPRSRLLRYGNLLTNRVLLCTDYWNHHEISGIFTLAKRPIRTVDTLVAPFGHYWDMLAFGGYYDFIFLIAAKLCRLQNALPNVDFSQTAIAYPLFNTSYEQEFLTLMGFMPTQIIDSRRIEVRAKTYVLGSGGDWFYPNLADVLAVRDRLAPLIVSSGRRKRIYISRTGRRRVLNEAELVVMLARYDIDFIEDKPRTLAEQLSIYHNASFIIGPHGASFSNCIWCQPGTHLFELFAPDYVPDFFLYLAQLTGLRYSAYTAGTPAARRPDPAETIENDLTVSVPDLEQQLQRLFTGDPVSERHRAG